MPSYTQFECTVKESGRKDKYVSILGEDLTFSWKFWQDQQKCAQNHNKHRLEECNAPVLLYVEFTANLLRDQMLEAMSIFMLICWNNNLFPFKVTGFQFEESIWCRVTPLRNKYNE